MPSCLTGLVDSSERMRCYLRTLACGAKVHPLSIRRVNIRLPASRSVTMRLHLHGDPGMSENDATKERGYRGRDSTPGLQARHKDNQRTVRIARRLLAPCHSTLPLAKHEFPLDNRKTKKPRFPESLWRASVGVSCMSTLTGQQAPKRTRPIEHWPAHRTRDKSAVERTDTLKLKNEARKRSEYLANR